MPTTEWLSGSFDTPCWQPGPARPTVWSEDRQLLPPKCQRLPQIGSRFKEIERNMYLLQCEFKSLPITSLSSHKRSHDVWLHLCEMSRVGESIRTESRLVVALGCEGWRVLGGGGLLMGSGFFLDDEDVLKSTVVMVVPVCEYTKHHGIVHFQWVSCMVHELYSNKDNFKNHFCLSVVFFTHAEEFKCPRTGEDVWEWRVDGEEVEPFLFPWNHT